MPARRKKDLAHFPAGVRRKFLAAESRDLAAAIELASRGKDKRLLHAMRGRLESISKEIEVSREIPNTSAPRMIRTGPDPTSPHVGRHRPTNHRLYRRWPPRQSRPRCPSLIGVAEIARRTEVEDNPNAVRGAYLNSLFRMSFELAAESYPAYPGYWASSYAMAAELLCFEFPPTDCPSILEFDLTVSGQASVWATQLGYGLPTESSTWRMDVGLYADGQNEMPAAYPALDQFATVLTERGGSGDFLLPDDINEAVPIWTTDLAGEFDVRGGQTSRLFVMFSLRLQATRTKVEAHSSSNYWNLLPPDDSEVVGVAFHTRSARTDLPHP